MSLILETCLLGGGVDTDMTNCYENMQDLKMLNMEAPIQSVGNYIPLVHSIYSMTCNKIFFLSSSEP